MPAPKTRGRPPADPEFGAQPGAMRQKWYRRQQDRLYRRMARLLLDLWGRQPAAWREEHAYVHADVLDLAHRLMEKPDD